MPASSDMDELPDWTAHPPGNGIAPAKMPTKTLTASALSLADWIGKHSATLPPSAFPTARVLLVSSGRPLTI